MHGKKCRLIMVQVPKSFRSAKKK